MDSRKYNIYNLDILKSKRETLKFIDGHKCPLFGLCFNFVKKLSEMVSE